MRKPSLSIILLITAHCLVPFSLMAEGFTWRQASPASVGMDSLALARMGRELANRRTTGLLVIRRDKIVYEWYATGHGPDKPHYTASLAKALVGGMSLAVAMDDGRISETDTAAKFIPQWRNDPLRRLITIRHLATHSSGIEDAETPGLGHFEQSGWKLNFWKREPDPFSPAINDAPVIFTPGEVYHYSNPGMAALAYTVTASLQGAPQDNILDLLRERVMRPIGVPDEAWSIGYGQVYELDGLKLVANWGGGGYTARAAAAVGRLMLRKGNWDGKQLINIATVEKVLRYAGGPVADRSMFPSTPACGLGFYTNFDRVWANVPPDAFAGAGAGNQMMLVAPSLELIVIRNGEMLDTLNAPDAFWSGAEKYLFNPVMAAIKKEPPPYPPSKVIGSIEFEPAEGIAFAAEGCDNWPITWTDDGEQITAYGDGWGFEPRVEKKLSNGLARIIGGPENWRGENIRTESGETLGDGAAGEKASGMLMVEGVLYMWMRNAGNSSLWWSEDKGHTWEKGFRLETSFGCPAFLNFGQNYQGARDDYVYTYSQDGPSAYETYDAVVLARAPKNRLRERDAWEFYCGTDGAGKPLWTGEIDQRRPVFEYPGHCHRLDVVYHPGIKRYLLALAHNHLGAWGIFDAPNPWGPWTTAFHTDYWGLGDTHGYRIPAKWIDPASGDFYLVFSGRTHEGVVYDQFCVRKATLKPAASPGDTMSPGR